MKIYLLKVELGFIGYDMTCLVRSDDISEKATELALDHYYSYDLDDESIRSVNEICEQDGVDEEEAELIRNEEVLENIEIEYEEYDVSKHGDINTFSWVDFDSYDIKPYLREGKINQILK